MKLDRRTARTKELIFNAFLELVVKRGYERVNVQSIVDAANVGRSTFYTHFDDKEDVLDSSLARLFENIYASIDEKDLDIALPVADICLHIQESELMKNAFELEFIAKKFHHQMQLAIFKHLSRQSVDHLDKNELTIYSHMLAGSCRALLVWWITSGMQETPEEIAEYFSKYRVEM